MYVTKSFLGHSYREACAPPTMWRTNWPKHGPSDGPYDERQERRDFEDAMTGYRKRREMGNRPSLEFSCDHGQTWKAL